MSYVNHGSMCGLVRRFQGSETTGRRKIYMVLIEVKRGTFWQGNEVKFLDL